jgi:two-component system, OmpR family, response regulator
MRLLVIEDHDHLAQLLRRGLEEEGYAVDVAATGEEGMAALTVRDYDLVVLDLVLPGMDGFEVLGWLRRTRQATPVLVLTARDAVEDRVRGLDTGADDYVMKPFAFPELLARVRALLRRGPMERAPVIAVGDLVMDPAAHEVRRGDAPIELTAKEFALLRYLMRHPGQVLTRDRLLEHAWDGTHQGVSNVVDVYVRYLREKVDRPFGVRTIETVRGVGYRLKRP